MTDEALDQLLDIIDVRLDAFAVCEIARNYSLSCEALEPVVVHFVLKGEGFLSSEHGRQRLDAGAVAIVPRLFEKSLSGIGPIEHVRDMQSACPLQDGLVCFKASESDADLILGCAVVDVAAGSKLQLFEHLDRPLVRTPEGTQFLALFDTMLEELRDPRVGTRAFVSALMKQILVILLRPDSDSQEVSLFPAMNPRLAAVAAMILKNPQDNHTIDSLARAAGMSRSRFNHHFSTAYRCSPKEFVRSARLASAAKLLNGSSLPVKSVAASVGYASRSHFSRAFQAKYGSDPSEYRRSRERDPAFLS